LLPLRASTALGGQSQPRTESEEEEEERRRRALLLDLPFPAGLAAEGQPAVGNVPVVQGTPQISGGPVVQGTPSPLSGAPNATGLSQSAAPNASTFSQSNVPSPPSPVGPPQAPTGAPSAPTGSPTPLPQTEPPHPQREPHHHERHHRTPSGKLHAHRSRGSAPKWLVGSIPKWLLIAIIALVVVAGSAAAVVGLSHGQLPGTGASSSASSSQTGSTPSSHAKAKAGTTPTAGAKKTATTGPTADLTFSGVAAGHMIVRITSICGSNKGSSGKYYGFSVLVTLSGQNYIFDLYVTPYRGPGTYTPIHTGAVTRYPGGNENTGVWGASSGTVTISSDEKSGTLDISYTGVADPNLLGPPGTAPAGTFHVVGNWTCG
jgi:hypothetical protein